MVPVMKARLESVANLAVIGTCVVLVGLTMYRRVVPDATGVAIRGYQPGDALEASLTSLLGQAGMATVLIKLSADCEYCSISMSQYQELARARDEHALPARIVVASSDASDVVRAYLMERLDVDGLIDLRAIQTRLSDCPVPYTLVVDASGTIVGGWSGMVTHGRLERIVDAVLVAAGRGRSTSPETAVESR